MGNIFKEKIDKVIRGQKQFLYSQKRKWDTIQGKNSQVWGRST
jgi:hypothetical protein